MNVNWYRVRLQLVVNSVQLFVKTRLRHNTTQASHQMLKNRSFTPCKEDRRICDTHVSADRVERDIACPQQRTQCTARPTQQGFRSCDEFRRRERFDEIIV